MKKGKRCLALLLCVMLLCSLTVIPAHAEEAADHEHVWGNGQWTTEGYDCVLGKCQSYYETCSICGIVHYIAYREWNSQTAKGAHTWTTREVSTDCPAHPTYEKTCSVCGQTETIRGGHNWGPWTAAGGNSCTGISTRECSDCHQTETSAAKGHSWVTFKTTPATCTEPAKLEQRCSRCGATQTVEQGAALGHNYAGSGSCAEPHTCSRCGKTINGYAHTWGAYVVTAEGHYQRCQQCNETTPVTKHSDSGNGYCVCGKQVATAQCSHKWTIEKQTSAFTHQEKCTLCGATRSVNCTESTIYTPRTDCTTTEYCACGHVRREPQKNHNFGTWRCTDSTHTHACLNIGCQYSGTPEPHTFRTVSGGLRKCSVCSYTDPKSLASHTHSYSTSWTADETGHWKACLCGDKQGFAGHTFAEGVCTVCGYQEPIHTDAEHQQPSTQDPGTQNPETQSPETQSPETQKPETQSPETQKPSTKEDFMAEAVKRFSDVEKDVFYTAPVGWAVQLNITNGTKDKTFAPNETCTQIQILTMLYRAQRGFGAADAADMDAAVVWATEKGIIGSDFEPDKDCTRATAVTYMWKAANSPKAGTPTFSDVSGSAGYAQAVAWAVANGVTNGTDTQKNTFSPDKTCTRGQIVTFLYREAVEPLQE